jgi:hypothetical protein
LCIVGEKVNAWLLRSGFAAWRSRVVHPHISEYRCLIGALEMKPKPSKPSQTGKGGKATTGKPDKPVKPSIQAKTVNNCS